MKKALLLAAAILALSITAQADEITDLKIRVAQEHLQYLQLQYTTGKCDAVAADFQKTQKELESLITAKEKAAADAKKAAPEKKK